MASVQSLLQQYPSTQLLLSRGIDGFSDARIAHVFEEDQSREQRKVVLCDKKITLLSPRSLMPMSLLGPTAPSVTKTFVVSLGEIAPMPEPEVSFVPPAL